VSESAPSQPGGRGRSVIRKALESVEALCRSGHYLQAYEILDDVSFRKDFDLDTPWGYRFQSYYGLTVAMAFGQISRAERLCREALEAYGYDADLAYNLAMVYLRCRRRDLAFREFHNVMRCTPKHAPTRGALRRLGVRTIQLFPFLDRSHPLNKYPGMLLYRARRALRSRRASAATPAA
jgi:hypothetical protein